MYRSVMQQTLFTSRRPVLEISACSRARVELQRAGNVKIKHLAKEQVRRAVIFVQADDVIDWYDLGLVSSACLPLKPVDRGHPDCLLC